VFPIKFQGTQESDEHNKHIAPNANRITTLPSRQFFFSWLRTKLMMSDKAEDNKVPVDENLQHGETINVGLHRNLKNRHIQLIAIGGSIGTALFVSIGNGLGAGGPASLLIAYTLYCMVLATVNNCLAEMTVLHPLSGGFIRLAGKWVDDAVGFMVGWNFLFVDPFISPRLITYTSIPSKFHENQHLN
jgi:amino acid permease